MASLDYLRSEKEEYSMLKSKIFQVIEYLNNAIEALGIPSNKIEESFSINDSSGDSKIIARIREDLISKKDYLYNNVVNEIDGEIANLSNEIQKVLNEVEVVEEEKKVNIPDLRTIGNNLGNSIKNKMTNR